MIAGSWLRLRILLLAVILTVAEPLHAEYLRIQLRVYGLDCGLCARGVAASVQRLAGVKSVDVNLKAGLLKLELSPGNTFKMIKLRKVIRENGFRSLEATITAVGHFNTASRFEVTGSDETYDVPRQVGKDNGPMEVTFSVR